MDSHADTSCAGANCLKVADVHPPRNVDVYGFKDDYAPAWNVPVATVAILWHDPKNGQPYILIIHEALYFGDRMSHTLLMPNQLHANGLLVQDVPQQFDANSLHSIVVPKLGITIPLSLRGVISSFESMKPSWEEYENLPHIELTADTAWDPLSSNYANKEEKLMSISGVRTLGEKARHVDAEIFESDNLARHVHAVRSLYESRDIVELVDGVNDEDDDRLGDRLVGNIHIAPNDLDGNGMPADRDDSLYPKTDQSQSIMALSTTERKSVLTAPVLAKCWNIGLDAAARTMRVTTQAGIRNIYAPSECKLRQRLDHMRFPNL